MGVHLRDKDVSDDLTYIYSVLSHPIRRKIIELVSENDISFTELMQGLDFKETGKLTFHLRQMDRVLKKTSDGKYKLSTLGRVAYKVTVEGEKSIGLKKFSLTEDVKKMLTDASSDIAGLLYSPSHTLRRVYRSQNSFLLFSIFVIALFPLIAFILRFDLFEFIKETAACFLLWFASVYLFKHLSEHFYRKNVNLRNLLYTTGLASFPLTLARLTYILTQPFSDMDKLIFSSSSMEEAFSKILPVIFQPGVLIGLMVTGCFVSWFIYLEICTLEQAARSPS